MKKLSTPFRGMSPSSAAPQAETNADSSQQGWIFDARLHGKSGAGQEFLRPNADQVLLSIVENSDDAIVTKNLDGIVSSWNKAAERIFGYTAEELSENPLQSSFRPTAMMRSPLSLLELSEATVSIIPKPFVGVRMGV